VAERGLSISDELLLQWRLCIEELLNIQCGKDDAGHPQPQIITLDTQAKSTYIEWTKQHAAEVNHPEFFDKLRGPWSKLKSCCGRLILIIHELRRALCGGVTELIADKESVQAAITLINYLKSHTKKVQRTLGRHPDHALASRILQWLRQSRIRQFSKRDAFQAIRGSAQRADALDGPLRLLEQHMFIRAVPNEARPGPGRKPSPQWEVNPSVVVHPEQF
jgi:hypothetical protein